MNVDDPLVELQVATTKRLGKVVLEFIDRHNFGVRKVAVRVGNGVAVVRDVHVFRCVVERYHGRTGDGFRFHEIDEAVAVCVLGCGRNLGVLAVRKAVEMFPVLNVSGRIEHFNVDSQLRVGQLQPGGPVGGSPNFISVQWHNVCFVCGHHQILLVIVMVSIAPSAYTVIDIYQFYVEVLSMHDPQQCVAGAPIFAGLPAPIIAQLAQISTHQQPVAKGALLYAAGEPAERMLVVDSGRVKVFRTAADGTEHIMYLLEPRSVDSEAALFADVAHQNSAVAITDARVCSIRRDDFRELVATTPQLAVSLLSAFGNRLTMLENRSAGLGTLTAHDRLLRYLEDTGAHLRTNYFRLPMSKHDLAGWLSITPETLSRNLKQLVTEGRIAMQGRWCGCYECHSISAPNVIFLNE